MFVEFVDFSFDSDVFIFTTIWKFLEVEDIQQSVCLQVLTQTIQVLQIEKENFMMDLIWSQQLLDI